MLVAMLVAGLWFDRRLLAEGRFGWCGPGLVCLFGVPALFELIDLLGKAGAACPRWPTFLLGLFFLPGKFALLAWGTESLEGWWLSGTALAVLVLAFLLVQERELRDGAQRAGGAALALAFALFISFMIDVGHRFGTPILFALVLTTKAGDIGAYLSGRFLGRHKLIPHISPNKTWEGLIGGYVLSMAAGVFLFHWLGEGRWSIPSLLVTCFLINTGGVLGDLVESLVKRAAGAKDSGALVPEFGGALDMLDSLFLSSPIGYGLLVLTATSAS